METSRLHKKMNEAFGKMTKDVLSLSTFASGRTRQSSSSPEMFMYYSAFPSASSIGLITTEKNFLVEPLVKHLKGNGWTLHRTHEVLPTGTDELRSSYSLWMNELGYMLSMHTSIHRENTRKRGSISYYVSQLADAVNVDGSGPAITDLIEMYYPMEFHDTPGHNNFVEELLDAFSGYAFKANKTRKIGIISHDGSDYYVKNFSLDGKVPQFIHVDEHYGEGFGEFHEKMIDRIKKDSKGLVLFHGDPGTGKTQYIRMLLDQLTQANKSILYVPPSFSSQLTEPQMIEFVSDWVLDEDQDCILLIEDAEPLLEVRNGADGRSTGISNLLNMTDGILNDMLGLMVIATFNTSISKIDSALLRPQRLIARKEFCKISELQAHKLAQALNVPFPEIEYPATLAEFYTVEQSATVLVHTVKDDNKKIGFK